MAQITTGIRSILSHPFVYRSLQNLLGANNARMKYVKDYIRPFDHAKILDIGCGPADIINFFPQSVEYFGFDLNAEYIDYAKSKYSHRGRFICNDVNNELKDLPQFDIVLATGLLHHLDDVEAKKLFTMANAALKPNGRLITFDCCYVENQSRLAKYIISKDRGQNVRFADAYMSLAQAIFPQVQQKVRHDLLRIPYTHIILECTK